MDKREVIIFGGGSLFEARKCQILSSCNIAAIADNNIQIIEERYPDYKAIRPDELIGYKDIPIIISADAIADIMMQIASIIGCAECEKRVCFARFEFPLADWELEVSRYGFAIKVTNDNAKFVIDDKQEIVIADSKRTYQAIYRYVSRQRNSMVDTIINMSLVPVDNVFGLRRGVPIDRYYIQRFLNDERRLIKGRCLEIAENTYTKEYGGTNVTESVILHVEGWGENAIKGNLETGDGIQENAFDSMIITQTLMFIYDINSTIKNIHKALKNNGTALITVAGISKISRYDDENWGMFHSFYKSGLEKAFALVFGKENVEIVHYGNVKTAVAFLYGIVVEELKQDDFDYTDEDYPVIYGIVAQKRD